MGSNRGWIEEPLPKSGSGERKSLYRDIVKDFIASDAVSGRVTLQDKAPITVYQQLRKVVPEDGSVRVVKRGDDVYLVKD